jgi:hypothetical protein
MWNIWGEWIGAYMVLVGKCEGKRPLGRPRHRSEDNIKMDLQEMAWEAMDWIDVAQDRHVMGCYQNGSEPSDSIKCGELLAP